MATSIINDNISAQLSGNNRRVADDKNSGASHASAKPTANTQQATAAEVDRASEKLAQITERSDAGNIQTSQDARSALDSLKSLIQNNPNQAMAAYNSVNATAADAALSA